MGGGCRAMHTNMGARSGGARAARGRRDWTRSSLRTFLCSPGRSAAPGQLEGRRPVRAARPPAHHGAGRRGATPTKPPREPAPRCCRNPARRCRAGPPRLGAPYPIRHTAQHHGITNRTARRSRPAARPLRARHIVRPAAAGEAGARAAPLGVPAAMALHIQSAQLGGGAQRAQAGARALASRPSLDPLHAARLRSHSEATCSYSLRSGQRRRSGIARAQQRSPAARPAQAAADESTDDDDIGTLGLEELAAAGSISSQEEENPYSTMDALRWAEVPALGGCMRAQASPPAAPAQRPRLVRPPPRRRRPTRPPCGRLASADATVARRLPLQHAVHRPRRRARAGGAAGGGGAGPVRGARGAHLPLPPGLLPAQGGGAVPAGQQRGGVRAHRCAAAAACAQVGAGPLALCCRCRPLPLAAGEAAARRCVARWATPPTSPAPAPAPLPAPRRRQDGDR